MQQSALTPALQGHRLRRPLSVDLEGREPENRQPDSLGPTVYLAQKSHCPIEGGGKNPSENARNFTPNPGQTHARTAPPQTPPNQNIAP